MAERDLLVRIIGDDKDLQRALRNTDRRLESIDTRTQAFGRNVGRAFAAAGVAIGTSEIFRLAGDSVAAASDLNEQLSRTRVILGESAEATIAWSRTTADSLGISQRAALAATSTFAGLFQTVGVDTARAGELSQSLVKLAADLASLQNTRPEEALIALRSGLAGESEPLRRFNIFLTEARVAREALIASGKKSTAALTQEEKTLARYNLILQDSILAQGNFADTSGELANQSRILRANLDDLSASIGGTLIPVLTGITGAANAATDALSDLGGVEIAGGLDVGDLAGYIGGWKTINFLIDQAKGGIDEVASASRSLPRPDDIGGPRGPGAIEASNLAVEAVKAERAAKEATAARERTQKAFRELELGLSLKLDKARLTKGFADDIAALRELERAILRQIQREGKTFQLVQLLTDTRLQINSLVETAAAEAQQAGEDAFNATISALDLNLEMARSTRSLEDDRAALRAIEQAILRRIAAEGQSTDLLRQLFNVREEQKRVAEQLREQARERRQGRQFEALGLTEEGDRPTPGVGALSRRLQNLRDQIKGTVLDTEKTRRELDRIAAVLSGKFGAVGKEVREAILQMFNDITGALEGGGSNRRGPLTKTSGLNTKKILEGLGLSDEEINALRGRLSSINSAGQELGGLGTPGPTRRIREAGFGNNPIFVESHTTINLDGQQVAKVVTKQQQKTKRRNPTQKRGPNRNR
jgi:hypothetical protein